MRKRKIWLILAILAFAAAGVCIFFVWKKEKDKEATVQMYEQMRQEARLEEMADETEAAVEGAETESPATEAETAADLVIPVDFKELEEVNPDIYAWITIPGTAIDYPVVQNMEDSSFYLTRSAEREESVSGAIFSENLNKTDFSDVHTVLYGHNMKDGSMFADLHKYEDEEFFEDHQEISVYTPDAIRSYRIFAAYVYDDRHLLQSFDCEEPDIFEAYIRSVKEQRSLYAHIDKDVKIEAGDHILTLSTCHSMGNEYRYLVQAVLEKTVKKQK